jgi:predicted ATPase with chaperone activity
MPEVYVHGARASNLKQVIDFLSGDAHDRSKVQIYANGRFWDFEDVVGQRRV